MGRSNGLSEKYADKAAKVTILIVLIALSFRLLYPYLGAPPEDAMKERTFILRASVSYENLGADVWNLTEEDYTIGLFTNNSRQTVYLVNHSTPVKSYEIDEDGNHIAVLNPQENQVFPETVLSYDVEYKIITKPHSIPDMHEQHSLDLSDIPETMKEKFSRAEGPWQVNDPEIVDSARKIVGNETNVLTIVEKFVKWINGNIGYKTRDIPRYPNETLKERFGDCDDQANLLITFCRIYGIPAHLQMGCIYLPNKINDTSRSWDGHLTIELSRIGWHGWAMIYVPPWGWLPVDLTYAQGISTDPLNAIKRSAVTSQETVQYANITRTDYIALSIGLRSFLREHGLYICERDEMVEESTIAILADRLDLFANLLIVEPALSRRPKIMAKTYK